MARLSAREAPQTVQVLTTLRHLLDQKFVASAPNQVWLTDITYVATDEGWLYLAGVKGLYSCEIDGYAMGEHMTQQLTGQALFAAYKKHRPP